MIENRLTEIRYLAQQGKRAIAKRDVIALIKARPDYAAAWQLLAELLDNEKDKAKCYQKLLEIDPNNEAASLYFERLHNQDGLAHEQAQSIPALFDDESDVNAGFTHGDTLDDEDPSELYALDTTQDATHPIDDALALYVIKELGSHVDADDVIREVSLRSQMDWDQAEEYVRSIESTHALAIAKRRSPLHMVIAIPTLIAGAVWFVFTLVYVLSNGNNALSFTAVLLESSRHFIGSIAMMLGGSIGIYRVLKSLGKI